MGTIGAVDPSVAAEVKTIFEQRCVDLLEWACLTLKSGKGVNVDWGEENITANIYVLIHDSQQSIDYDIHIECEHSFFDQDILDNKKKAKSASRIDMVFQHNWSGQRYSFYVEAKNLIETDAQKTGRKTKLRASSILDRYIETGIDHYLNKYYPLGCMLGYVLNGTIAGIVQALNTILIGKSRASEILSTPMGTSPWMLSKSTHAVQNMEIKHYLFYFN